MIFPPLYLIADPALYLPQTADPFKAEDRFFDAIREAIEGGVQWIQYRDKQATRGKKYEVAKKLSEMTQGRHVSLMINDDIDLALAVRAAGVHLGQDDFPVSMARTLLGPSAIIGLSTHDMKEAQEAASEAVNYIGFGPVFKTQTKKNADEPVGVACIAAVREMVSLPIYAIGGIQYAHLEETIAAGATGVAVASALADVKKETYTAWQRCLATAVSALELKKQ